jgi:hypothetical protein
MENFTPLRKLFETISLLCILMGLTIYAGYGQVVMDTVFAEHDVTLGSGDNFKAVSMDGGQLQMCNFDDNETLMSYFESWMKFNFTELAAEIPDGQDVLYASCVFRVSANAGPQGARFFHLIDIDDWDQATLSWDEAQTLDYENEANYDQFTEILPKNAGGTSARPEINVTDQVLYELGESGNQLFTLRAEPYVKDYVDNDPELDKRWLGFYSREVTWDDDGDPATMNVYCPQIILYIGPPEPKVFSDDADFGTIENFDLTPSKYGYWLVRDDEGDARLKINQRPAPINGTPGAVAVYNMETYGDFDIKLKAKLNKLSGDALDPKADFIVVFGYVGDMDYSYIRFTGEDINGFYKVDTTGGGDVTEVGVLNTNPAVTDTMYHDYRVVRSGTTVTAYIDEVEYMAVTDDALGTAGMIGMGSYNDIALFDDFMEGEGEPEAVYDLNQMRFTLYPNPAGDKLHIDAANTIEKLVISNIVGQEIQTIHDIGSVSTQLDVSSFQTGIYFITVHGLNDSLATGKFIKK